MKRTLNTLFGFSIILLTLSACNRMPSRGYDNLEDLYKASEKALKSKDKMAITEFIYDVFPDKNTVRYMFKNQCTYQKLPEMAIKYPNALDTAVVIYIEQFYDFALALDKDGRLDDLRFIGFKEKLSPKALPGTCEGVLFAVPTGLFVSPKNQDTVAYSFGEMLFINGKWKSFSNF